MSKSCYIIPADDFESAEHALENVIIELQSCEQESLKSLIENEIRFALKQLKGEEDEIRLDERRLSRIQKNG